MSISNARIAGQKGHAKARSLRLPALVDCHGARDEEYGARQRAVLVALNAIKTASKLADLLQIQVGALDFLNGPFGYR